MNKRATNSGKGNKSKYMAFPKTLDEAQAVLTKVCASNGCSISFNDKNGNFGHDRNACACGGTYIDCGKFYFVDLLVAAVLHEVSHVVGRETSRECTIFSNEFAAWNYAQVLHRQVFGRNFSMRQTRYVMQCLQSYIPNAGDPTMTQSAIVEKEGNFWCPMKKRVLAK